MAPYRVPPPGLFHHGVPSFPLAHGDLIYTPTHCRVLCQVLACWWREGLKCATAGSAPSRLDASPRSSWSSTNISQLHLPGPRNGLVGHRSWSSTNISQLHIHKVPERYRVVCASPSTADQLHLPGSRNGLVGQPVCPDTRETQVSRGLSKEKGNPKTSLTTPSTPLRCRTPGPG